MSLVREISRAAVGGYLKVVRLPADAALRLRQRNGGRGRRGDRPRSHRGRAPVILRAAPCATTSCVRTPSSAASRQTSAPARCDCAARRRRGKREPRSATTSTRRRPSGSARRPLAARSRSDAARRSAARPPTQVERVEQQRKEIERGRAEQAEEAVDRRAKRARLDQLDQRGRRRSPSARRPWPPRTRRGGCERPRAARRPPARTPEVRKWRLPLGWKWRGRLEMLT